MNKDVYFVGKLSFFVLSETTIFAMFKINQEKATLNVVIYSKILFLHP